jgi:hypothetical protein
VCTTRFIRYSQSIWFSNLSVLSVSVEGYFRNASYALNKLSTFLILLLRRYLCWLTISPGGSQCFGSFIQRVYGITFIGTFIVERPESHLNSALQSSSLGKHFNNFETVTYYLELFSLEFTIEIQFWLLRLLGYHNYDTLRIKIM